MRIRSLKTVLAVWVSLAVVAVVAANAAYLVLTTRVRMRERLEQNARLFAGLATEPLCRAYDTFYDSGFFHFRDVASDLRRQAPDVTVFKIVDTHGKLLFHSGELEGLPAPAEADRPSLDTSQPVERREFHGRDAGGEYLEIVVPYLDGLGRHRLSVAYRVSYARLSTEFQRSSLWTAGLTLVSVGLAVALGLGLARRVTRPLQALTEGVDAIARGQFERRLDLRSGDELQVVAEAFNHMAGVLQETVAELRRSLERWRSLVEGAPVTVVSASPAGLVEFINLPPELALRVLGRTLDELTGSPLPDEALAVLERVKTTGQPGSFEIQAATRGGGLGWYLVHAGAVREGARVVGLTLVGIDVTEARAARQERERLIAELERRNAELERFTYTVSHDLRSPLVTVKGFLGAVEAAAYKGQTERVRADVARIRTAADRMERLLRELLELSRVGRVAAEPQTVPFSEVVEEARAVVEGRLSARGVRVEVAPNLPSVRGDRPRLVEVVQNLIDNAAKFMGDQEHPRIEIGARSEAEQTVFFVLDNGIGIEPRYHEKVFGLFDRLDPKTEGTGVGLALVKRIVEVHGGRVWVESAGPGHGTAFCFTLPGPRPTASSTQKA